MSTPSSASIREPTRQRGHIRVAAILKAGAEVFSEKGYDAATMTEIAARSGTAIGSLYRFFPSKELLADALLRRYGRQVLDGLAELGSRTTALTPDGVADALVDFRLALQSQRSMAAALADARGGSADIRTEYRRAIQEGMADFLNRTIPNLPRTKADAMAVVLLHMLKGVSATAEETPAWQSVLLAEFRDLIRLYLAAARPAGDATP
jgi:AcrR family transcriptional regulator